MKKVKISNPDRLFFSSDHHFGHANIIKHCKRPYDSIDSMDVDLVYRWNSVVSVNDTIVYVGDLTMNANKEEVWKLLKKLNGTVIFVSGNHDIRFEKSGICHDMLLISVNDGTVEQRIHCCHYPMLSWYKMSHGSWHLYGHIHNNVQQHPSPRAWNVGVDVNNFSPISYFDIKKIITSRENHYDRSAQFVFDEA